MNAHVTKILKEPSSKKTYGVEIVRDGETLRVRAKKGVIVSGEAINSPQLLMLSRIGPKEHLMEHDIQVIQDLRVDHSIQNHISAGGLTFLVNEEIALVQSRLYNINNVLEYITLGKGPWTNLGNIERIAFINTKYANSSDDFPDIQLHCYSSERKDELIREIPGLTRECYDAYEELQDKDALCAYPTLLRPKSRGVIKLRSHNPFDYTLIYPNYFKEPEDMATLVEGVKFVLEMSKTASFKRYRSGMNPKPFPGCKHVPMYSDPYWECMIRFYPATIFHPVDTCKMGPKSDSKAVVDPWLRVYGVPGLRIIGSSIMPNLISDNTNAPTTMITEKGSDNGKTKVVERTESR